VDHFTNGHSHETKQIFYQIPLTIKMVHTMMLIAQYSLLFAALQFVVITRYYASLRLAKNKQQCTHSTEDFRFKTSHGLQRMVSHFQRPQHRIGSSGQKLPSGNPESTCPRVLRLLKRTSHALRGVPVVEALV